MATNTTVTHFQHLITYETCETFATLFNCIPIDILIQLLLQTFLLMIQMNTHYMNSYFIQIVELFATRHANEQAVTLFNTLFLHVLIHLFDQTGKLFFFDRVSSSCWQRNVWKRQMRRYNNSIVASVGNLGLSNSHDQRFPSSWIIDSKSKLL